MNKDYAIGETIQFGRTTLKVVPNDYCHGCFFFGRCDAVTTELVGECTCEMRGDRTDVIFKQVKE